MSDIEEGNTDSEWPAHGGLLSDEEIAKWITLEEEVKEKGELPVVILGYKSFKTEGWAGTMVEFRERQDKKKKKWIE